MRTAGDLSHVLATVECLAGLPQEVRKHARAAYRLFRQDPSHPGLRFKRVHAIKPVFSVRVSRTHRALGLRIDEEMLWFRIGSHDEYERLLKTL